jgi:AraC-like DNA-binding protein
MRKYIAVVVTSQKSTRFRYPSGRVRGGKILAMLFRSYAPSQLLRGFVHDFWLYDGYAAPHLRERILPSGTIELVVNLREDELRIYDPDRPDRCRRYSGALISGAYGRGFVSDTFEETSIIGVHFEPGGAFPFLGLPAGELADTHVDLEDLWGRPGRWLRERLCAAATPLERFRLMEEALTAHLFGPLQRHRTVDFALHAFVSTGGRARISDVSARVGLSRRRFIERFTAEVGMTPKLFCRIQRFHRILTLLRRRGAPDWADLALECGYFDQSHLIHDFVTFSGVTPAVYLDHQKGFRERGVHVKRNHLPLAR